MGARTAWGAQYNFSYNITFHSQTHATRLPVHDREGPGHWADMVKKKKDGLASGKAHNHLQWTTWEICVKEDRSIWKAHFLNRQLPSAAEEGPHPHWLPGTRLFSRLLFLFFVTTRNTFGTHHHPFEMPSSVSFGTTGYIPDKVPTTCISWVSAREPQCVPTWYVSPSPCLILTTAQADAKRNLSPFPLRRLSCGRLSKRLSNWSSEWGPGEKQHGLWLQAGAQGTRNSREGQGC